MNTREKWISKFKIKEHAWVFVPTEDTIRKGESIKQDILEKWKSPNCFYHLKSGGHVRALKEHSKNTIFLHVDIQNFFGNINRSRITRSLKQYFGYEKARDIASESTLLLPESSHKQYILPFGYVQSPIIASVCLSKSALGKYLISLARSADFVVTIYMDDIIVSGNDLTQMHAVLNEIRLLSDRSKFPINENKLEGPTSKIIAFNIKLSHESLQITPRRIESLKASFEISDNQNQRKGIVGYVSSVNSDQAKLFSE